MEQIYYIYEGNVQKGPFGLPEVQALAASGKIHRDALYWQPGMAALQPLATLKVFVPPPPKGQTIHSLQKEYNAPLYRIASYKRGVEVCLVGTLILAGVAQFFEPKTQATMICGTLLIPVVLYGLYCYLRYQAGLCGWGWGGFMFLVTLVFPVLILFRLIMSARKFKAECETHDLELDWVGRLKGKE